MPLYMVEAAFTPESWAKLAQSPEDRRQAVGPMVEKAGCKLLQYYFCFGKYDTVLVIEAPDAVSAAAVSITAAAAGHVRAVKTTPLFTVEEGMAAMKKAGGLTLKTPLSK